MSKILIDEATVKLALEALQWCHGGEPCGTAEAITALREALAKQPAQQKPVDFASLLREAEEIVRWKPTWKRFIDGTPLSNDIAVWMTVFAQDVARRTSPPPQQEPAEWLTGCPECGMDGGCDCDEGTWNPPAQQEPPWWPAVENILNEYGLQAIDFVADFKAALRKPLTDEEIENIWRRVDASDFVDCVQPFARAIEAKLKE